MSPSFTGLSDQDSHVILNCSYNSEFNQTVLDYVWLREGDEDTALGTSNLLTLPRSEAAGSFVCVITTSLDVNGNATAAGACVHVCMCMCLSLCTCVVCVLCCVCCVVLCCVLCCVVCCVVLCVLCCVLCCVVCVVLCCVVCVCVCVCVRVCVCVCVCVCVVCVRL